MRFASGVTVVVLPRSPGLDQYADLADGEGRGHSVPGCGVQHSSSVQQVDQRERGHVDALTVFAPPEADIVDGDMLEVPGHPGTWRVDGEPVLWSSPISGIDRGLVVAVHRATA